MRGETFWPHWGPYQSEEDRCKHDMHATVCKTEAVGKGKGEEKSFVINTGMCWDDN